MLFGCRGSGPEPQSGPVPVVESPPTPQQSDTVLIQGGTVQMGPRHVRPIDAGIRPPGPPPGDHETLEDVRSEPWVSKGGRGLVPKAVTVASFRMDRTEVTRRAYARFLQETGYRLPHVSEPWAEDGWNWSSTEVPEDLQNHPVVMVSFHDATAFCRWADKRLPTEAEWQIAVLGPRDAARDYPWGNRYRDQWLNHGRIEEPNFDDTDGYRGTAPVGSFPEGRSASGLDDAFGNAWEFTADARIDDWAHARHRGFGPRGEMIDAASPGPALRVAVRGGSYYFDFRPNPGGEWAAFAPEIRRKSSGFRCAEDVPAG